ncbi:MAG: hypothetical protein KatS3mg057_0234 [Herpetosiphonaceae bacterium]|nr:MAG: hypothetical protein KatS3mg057_0234 [Herpetosiphonaceae bacterium]
MPDPTIQSLVAQLKRVGFRPPEQLVEQILAAGEEVLQPLLALATDRKLLAQGGEKLLGPIHALRLLGELRSPAIIPPLLDLFPLNDETFSYDDPLLSLWEREVPQMIARAGISARDHLWSVARDAELPGWRRHVAIGALSHMPSIDPQLREEIITGLRDILANESDPHIVGSAVAGLGLLGARESYAQVMEAYKQKRVDTAIISPGLARQMLLIKRSKAEMKSCAAHPLWERYDEHGPTEQDLEDDDLD